jgi:hypothetical protein
MAIRQLQTDKSLHIFQAHLHGSVTHIGLIQFQNVLF